MKNIVIFASGSGSNALNLTRHFKHSERARVVAVFTDNPQAGVIDKAKLEGLPVVVFTRAELNSPGKLDDELASFSPDLILLAGFLRLFPQRWVERYAGHILNIHPALLPAYGGKGMYGDHVHRAVLAAGEKEHGVTIHYVNAHFDEGEILLQRSFALNGRESLDEVSEQIHRIEYALYPEAVER
ncbi:MAG: phosphoribosylglycinamide formyltransferase, partial [Bacteroidota bacterium]